MHLDQVVDINERLTRMMLHILDRHKDFAEKHRLTVHIERDELYRQLQYKISSLNPSSLHIINPDDVRLIGNGNTHDCCAEEQEGYKRNRCQWSSSSASFKTTRPFAGQTKCYSSESNFHLRNFMIGTTNIHEWSSRAWHPELLYASTAVLIVHDLLVVTLSPNPSNEVRWTTLFAPTPPPKTTIDTSSSSSSSSSSNSLLSQYKQRQQTMRFGVMLRYHMSSTSYNNNNNNQRRPNNLHHGLFLLPGGEMMNMPRPFVANGCCCSCRRCRRRCRRCRWSLINMAASMAVVTTSGGRGSKGVVSTSHSSPPPPPSSPSSHWSLSYS